MTKAMPVIMQTFVIVTVRLPGLFCSPISPGRKAGLCRDWGDRTRRGQHPSRHLRELRGPWSLSHLPSAS